MSKDSSKTLSKRRGKKMEAKQLNEGSMGFNNTAVVARTFSDQPFRGFRGKSGYAFRILFFEPTIMMRLAHSYNKKSRRCLSYLGFCPACKCNIPAKDVYGANVFVYPTDAAGNLVALDKVALFKPGIYFWKFGADKYVSLRNIVNQWGPITEYDLMIYTLDEQFQKLQIMNCKEAVCKVSKPFMDFLAELRKTDCYPVEKVTAKEVSAHQMVDDFGLDPAVLVNKAPEMKPQNFVASIPINAPVGIPQVGDFLKSNTPSQLTIPTIPLMSSVPMIPTVNSPIPVLTPVPVSIPTPVPAVVQEEKPIFWTLDLQNNVIQITLSELKRQVGLRGDIPVMSLDQSSGWKKASDFGIANSVSISVPSQSVGVGQGTTPISSAQQDFDSLFAGLNVRTTT